MSSKIARGWEQPREMRGWSSYALARGLTNEQTNIRAVDCAMNEIKLDASADYRVGYKRPPVHTRFKPGQSGNPSGRRKGSQNFRTLLDKVLNEQIPLIDGNQSRKVTKAEAITRRLVIGALKGDSRSLMALMRIAEMTGQFEEAPVDITRIERIIITGVPRPQDELPALPAASELCTGEP